jgi:putative transposase
MPEYRRIYTPGASYFFTLNLQDRSSRLLTDHIDLLRSAFRQTKTRHPFNIDALVVLHEHLHALITLPEGDADYSTRWRLIKTWFSRHLPDNAKPATRRKFDEADIWQRRFWARLIIDESDYRNHVNYIHINPVKHGLVSRVADWPYSSFHRYVANGVLPLDWACGVMEIGAGER